MAGALITVQAGSNSQLKKSLDAPMAALTANYIVGILSVVAYMLLSRAHVPEAAKMGDAPWWSWMGGFFGAFYGVSVVLLASQMGAATLTALVVTGQLICSVILDHYGWIGFDIHPASAWRIFGCGLMVVGLMLIAKF